MTTNGLYYEVIGGSEYFAVVNVGIWLASLPPTYLNGVTMCGGFGARCCRCVVKIYCRVEAQ